MKAKLFIICFFLMASLSLFGQAVGSYLLELENHIKWESVDSKWAGLRNKWISDCKSENSPQKCAQLLLVLESNIKWEAVEVKWSKRRNEWVNECNQAISMAKVIALITELESNIKWSAVDEKWKSRRSRWINELNEITRKTQIAVNKSISLSNNYNSVLIGNQIWMTENLNVDKFRNGDPIMQVKTVEEWENAKRNKQPAWWYCDNKDEYGQKYGKLYNWYAINDPRGLAPEGWHVPSENEWGILYDYLGYGKASVPKLKSKTGWDIDKNGTNDSGFNALPGGNSYEWKCYNTGKEASWWSTQEFTTEQVTVMTLHEYDYFQIDHNFKYSGNSVRCVKNK